MQSKYKLGQGEREAFYRKPSTKRERLLQRESLLQERENHLQREQAFYGETAFYRERAFYREPEKSWRLVRAHKSGAETEKPSLRFLFTNFIGI